MLIEPDEPERIKMREELIELLTVRFIEKLVLKSDGLQVWVYFKPRRNGQQDVLIISIASREDGGGRIEQWGQLDPATGEFVRTGPNCTDLADIHLAMTTGDRESFLWNDRWLVK